MAAFDRRGWLKWITLAATGYGLVPRRIAQALDRQGLNNPHLFNRLAVVAAFASLREADYVREVAAKVARERELWTLFLRDLRQSEDCARLCDPKSTDTALRRRSVGGVPSGAQACGS